MSWQREAEGSKGEGDDGMKKYKGQNESKRVKKLSKN
jgi:hypothetical protein